MVVFGVVRPPEPGAQSEIGQLDVAVAVDEDVVGLDVTMDEAHFVDAFHGARQFGNVKSVNLIVTNLIK